MSQVLEIRRACKHTTWRDGTRNRMCVSIHVCLVSFRSVPFRFLPVCFVWFVLFFARTVRAWHVRVCTVYNNSNNMHCAVVYAFVCCCFPLATPWRRFLNTARDLRPPFCPVATSKPLWPLIPHLGDGFPIRRRLHCPAQANSIYTHAHTRTHAHTHGS